MPQIVDEREPGVYVRNNKPDEELDFLWNREHRKTIEHDRFHLGFFAAGVVVGSLITFAACMLFFTGGQIFPSSEPEKAVVLEEQMVTPKELQTVAPPKAEPEKKPLLPFLGPQLKKEEPAPQTVSTVKARFYEIQSGDTLGSIAIKFYHSSDPDRVAKIQRANKMTDADTLSLGQRLVIPPADY